MMQHRILPTPLTYWQRLSVRSCFFISMILLVGYMSMKLGFAGMMSNIPLQSAVASVLDLHDFINAPASGDIILPQSQMNNLVRLTPSMGYLHQQVRRSIIKQMIEQGYTGGRNTRPYMSDGNAKIRLTSNGIGYEMTNITNADMLDLYIKRQLKQYASLPFDPSQRTSMKADSIIIDEQTRRGWSDLYLFKQQGDLEFLGYTIVSYRTRVNRDKEYRRFNIMTAFAKLGNVIVLNSGQQISYLRDIQYDGDRKQNYKYGLSIIGDEEIQDYGGGICGSSTALYQGILTNTALVVKQRGHSRWYGNLYPAFINGTLISTPGIDSALYGPSLDLIVTNIRPYPVVIVANYDGSDGGVEEVFSIAREQDRGSFGFVSSRKTTTVDTKGQTLKGGCYTRTINGLNKTTCYKKVQ